MGDEVQGMSTEDLISNLVTCDYRGQAFKRCCLDELLLRKTRDEIKNVQEVGVEKPIAQG
jgi:hypothetical protein